MPRWTRFRDLFGPDPRADVDEELAFHVEMRTRELVERGEAPERARERALARSAISPVPAASASTSTAAGTDAWHASTSSPTCVTT